MHVALPMFIITTSISSPTDDYSAHAATIDTTSQTISAYKLSNTQEFKTLPKEPILTPSAKELRDLKELQDRRLDECVEKGVFWEQCFIFGENDSSSNAVGNDRGAGEKDRSAGFEKRKPPTW